jgi:hypothetical protein
MFQETLTQAIGPIDQIVPSNTVNSATPVTSTGIDMRLAKRCIYFIQIGAFTGAGTVDARLQSSAQANFNVAHNISTTNIVQVTNTGPNTIVTLEVRSDEIMQANPGDRYCRLSVTIGANSVLFGAIGFGAEAPQSPGNQNVNTTVVTQQVVATI